MTTCVLKQDPVWLATLPVGVTSAPIILLGKDECQVAVPAPLLLAASPLLRRVLADLLPPAFSPCFVSIAVTEYVLKQVAGILSSGSVACEQEGEVEEVKQVLVMLGIESSLVSCDKYEDVLDKNIKVEDESEIEIEMEITDNTQDITITTNALKKENTLNFNINNTFVKYDNFMIKEERDSDNEDKRTVSFNRTAEYENAQKLTDESSFSQHMKGVHNDIEVGCNLCPLKFKRSDWRIHVMTVHNKTCHICTKQFKKKSRLKEHVDYVHKKIKVPCNLCPQGFSKMSHLARHINNIHNKIEFPCSLCALIFTDKSSLSEHMIAVHNYISCNLCPQVFSRMDHLRRHINNVHGKEEFPCSLCMKKYSRKGELLSHIKYFHNKIKVPCHLCPRGFSKLSHLRRHIRTAHDKVEFQCSLCTKKYLSKDELLGHIKLEHLSDVVVNIARC